MVRKMRPGDCCMWCEHSQQKGNDNKWNWDYTFTYCELEKSNVLVHQSCDDYTKPDWIQNELQKRG